MKFNSSINEKQKKMTFDLPDIPDIVNNINIEIYNAKLFRRVPICRLRPVEGKKKSSS